MDDKVNPKLILQKAGELTIVSIILLFFGAGGILCICTMGFSSDTVWPIVAMLTSGVSGIIGCIFSRRMTNRAKRYEKFRTVILRAQRIAITDLAAEMGLSPEVTQNEAQMLIDGGFLSLIYINHYTKEVVLRMETDVQSAQINVKCSQCGANNAALPGKSVICSYCGTKITAAITE